MTARTYAAGRRSSAFPMPIDGARRSVAPWIAALAACVLLGGPSGALADKALGGREIIEASHRAQRVAITDEIRMVMVDPGGSKRERKLEVRSKKLDGLWKVYQKFTYPPDIAGTQFLVVQQRGGSANDLVLYEPIAQRTRRINPAQRATRYMGTDFYYEDLDVIDVDEDVHRLVGAGKLALRVGDKTEEIDCWIVESTPKPSKATSYGRVVSWVQKSNFYTRQSEMYEQGKLVKRFRVLSLKRDRDAWVSTLSEMNDLRSGSHTIIQTVKYDLNASSIPDAIFTESYLLGGG